MNFKPFDAQAKDVLYTYLAHRRYAGSDYSAHAFLSWFDDLEYAESDGAFFLRAFFNGELRYWPPLVNNGLTLKEAVALLPENSTFCFADEAFKEELGDGYAACTNRDWSEYIYKTSDFIALTGKRYAAKRNHISRFLKNYEPQWSAYTADDYDEFLRFEEEWLAGHSFDGAKEESALKESRIVDGWLEASLRGELICEILRVDGKMAGISIAELMPCGSAVVMYEKANIAYDGVYSYLANTFAKRNLASADYINRQEDMGMEGLRKSKLSYYPEFLLDKYVLTPQSALKRDENGKLIRPCDGDSSLDGGDEEDDFGQSAAEHAKSDDKPFVLDSSKISVRQLAPADFNAAMTFLKCNIHHLEDKKFFLNYTDEELQAVLEDGYMAAILNDGHIIATCAVDVDKKFGEKLKAICRDESDRTFYEFGGIMVCRHYRRQGLARKICAEVLDYAKRNLKNVTLCACVQFDNVASLKNLENFGFVRRARAAYKIYDFVYLTLDIN